MRRVAVLRTERVQRRDHAARVGVVCVVDQPDSAADRNAVVASRGRSQIRQRRRQIDERHAEFESAGNGGGRVGVVVPAGHGQLDVDLLRATVGARQQTAAPDHSGQIA